MIRLLPVGLIVYSYFEIENNLPRIAARAPNGAAAPAISICLWVALFVEILCTGLLLVAPLNWPRVPGGRSLRLAPSERLHTQAA